MPEPLHLKGLKAAVPSKLPPRDPKLSPEAPPDPLGQEKALRGLEWMLGTMNGSDSNSISKYVQASPILKDIMNQDVEGHVQYNDPMKFVLDPTKDRIRTPFWSVPEK